MISVLKYNSNLGDFEHVTKFAILTLFLCKLWLKIITHACKYYWNQLLKSTEIKNLFS